MHNKSILLGFILSGIIYAQNIDSLVHHSFDFAEQQLGHTVIELGDSTRYPRSTLEDGSWSTKSSSSWASGFFPGCLWYMYEVTEDNTWARNARGWTAGMESEQYNTGTHDVGFMIFSSFGNGYRLMEDEAYKEVVLRAAQSLATRYNPTVGCLRSWDNRTFPVIIDNMMNLELLFWAAKNGGGSALYDMALSHALRTMVDHVRDDGSTYQIVDYNPTAGTIILKETHQGYSDESTWARGQSWGLYGFTMTYRETGDVRFMETAKRLADYIIDNLPDDHVPYWDYDAPNIPDEKKDASAAAIAASGLLELSTLVSDESLKAKYRGTAESILGSLMSDSFLAEGSTSHGILLHGVGNHNGGTEVDVSLIYADYYFLEALLRYQSLTVPLFATPTLDNKFPEQVQLQPNYPNPFNISTYIPYHLGVPSEVVVILYDVNGRRIGIYPRGRQSAGDYRFLLDTSFLSSGIYLVQLQANDRIHNRKITLIK
ncbi:glycoside hydrolase family 88 protein [Candidatus Neomarinimicrobiota bacterium]